MTDLKEGDIVARRAAAEAMGVRVCDVRIIRGRPEYRPKLPGRSVRRRASDVEKYAGKHVFVIAQGR